MPIHYRGGMSSIGYKLGKQDLITGFGKKRRYGRGDEMETMQPEPTIKRSTGRPRKIITEPDYTEEEEDEYVEPKKRGRKPKTHLFTSNIVSTLNDLMGQLSLEEQLIKQQEQNQELKKEELKKIRAMQKSISKAYLTYA